MTGRQNVRVAFDQFKKLLTEAHLLAHPNISQPFLLKTDSSISGLGAVLAQCSGNEKQEHPNAYASRTLLPREANYGISELEGLGVVWVVKHFRHYLYGHKCHVYTDHEALKALINTPHPSGNLLVGHWLCKGWILRSTTDQEKETRMQMPCPMLLQYQLQINHLG